MEFKVQENQPKEKNQNTNRSNVNGLYRTHSMRLRSDALRENIPQCTLLPLSLRHKSIKPTINRPKRISNADVRRIAGTLAELTIVRKRENSECSDENYDNGDNGGNPKGRKRIRLMETMQESPLQIPWPECLTDTELAILFRAPIVYTLPTGVEESNRDRFIQYIKNHMSMTRSENMVTDTDININTECAITSY